MKLSRRSPLLMSFLAAFAVVMLTIWTVEPVAAQRSSRNSSYSSSSSRRSVSRSTRDDDNDYESDDDYEDGSGSDSRRSRARSSRDSRSSSSRSSRSSSRSSSRRSSSSRGRSANYAPPAVVFGSNYETVGLRPRGNLLSVEAFESLPCSVSKVAAGAKTYYRCGETWYNQVNHEGWVCYSEVFPPAGSRVTALPKKHEVVRAGGRTLYATTDAFYEAVKDGDSTRYVVVEPAVGTVLDRLPEQAKAGIPVRSGRNDYYRYLGVFYREETVNGVTRYVASLSPFSTPVSPVASATTVPASAKAAE
jgi:hypothetical protein